MEVSLLPLLARGHLQYLCLGSSWDLGFPVLPPPSAAMGSVIDPHILLAPEAPVPIFLPRGGETQKILSQGSMRLTSADLPTEFVQRFSLR